MQRAIIAFSCILLSLTTMAQEKKVAVFDPAGNVDEAIKVIVREQISSSVVNASGYTVLERQQIDKVLEENKFQMSGLVDDAQISEIGKAMGANTVFVSSITAMNNNFFISSKMIDVQTAHIIMQRTAQTQQGTNDLIEVVKKMMGEMLGNVKSIPENKDLSLPTSNFSKKEVETFDSNKFGWKADDAKDASAKINKGYYELNAKRSAFNPQPVKIESFAKLPLDITKNFKITVKVYIDDLKGTGVFRILLNSGSIIFAIAESDWAVSNNVIACQGMRRLPQKDYVTLTIQKEKGTLFFFYNESLVCSSNLEKEIISSEFGLSLMNVVNSAKVKIDEVIIEQ